MLSGFQERSGSWSTTVNRATSCMNVNMPPEGSSVGLQALLVTVRCRIHTSFLYSGYLVR